MVVQSLTASPSLAKELAEAEVAAENKAIDKYIRGLTYDAKRVLAKRFTASGEEDDKPLGDTVESHAREVVITKRRKSSLSQNAEEVSVFQPAGGVIYPGSIVRADEHLLNGTPTPITALIGTGAQVTLKVSLANSEPFTIDTPEHGNVSAGIEAAVSKWLTLGKTASSTVSYKSTQSYNSVQTAMALGLSAESLEGKVEGHLKLDTDSEANVVVAMVQQPFYTVQLNTPPSPSVLFKDQATVDEVRAHITETAPPCYVSSVTYGRILLVKIETDKTLVKGEAEALLEYAKGDNKLTADAKAKVDSLSQNAKITVAAIGSGSEEAVQVLSVKTPEELVQIVQDGSGLNVNNHGMPIAYRINFLKDNVLAKMAYTHEYVQEDYEIHRQGQIVFRNNNSGVIAHFCVLWDEKDYKTGKLTRSSGLGANMTFDEIDKKSQQKPYWRATDVLAGQERRCEIPPNAVNIVAKVYHYNFGVFSSGEVTWPEPPRDRVTMTGTTFGDIKVHSKYGSSDSDEDE